MLHVIKSRWRNRWHVYEIDTGGRAWLASFSSQEAAADWVKTLYDNDQ